MASLTIVLAHDAPSFRLKPDDSLHQLPYNDRIGLPPSAVLSGKSFDAGLCRIVSHIERWQPFRPPSERVRATVDCFTDLLC